MTGTADPPAPAPARPDEFYPVVVIGGGLAGSAAAAMLARGGHRVALFDRDTFPRDKLCGEFLSGESRCLLSELGCLEEILRAAPPAIPAMEFTSPGGTRLHVPLPSPALGVSRRTLEHILFRHAARCGARTFENCEVRDIRIIPEGAEVDVALLPAPGERAEFRTVRTSLIIAGYGRSSHLDRTLNRQAPLSRSRSRFVGLKRHHLPCPTAEGQRALEDLSRRGEMHSFRGGYCGVAPVDGGFINVCLLLRSAVLKQLAPSGRWEELAPAIAAQNPALALRLSTLIPCPDRPTLSVSPVPFSPRPKAAGPILFAGDAAGMIAPLCGDGQAMALDSALRLARLILGVPEAELSARAGELASAWSRLWDREYARRVRLGQWLQHLTFEPRVTGPFLRLLSLLPGSAAALARATRGSSE